MAIAVNVENQMNDDRPWGLLSGVRPAKIVHRRLDQGEHPQDILQYLINRYEVSPSKAKLLIEVAMNNRCWVPGPATAEAERLQVSLYLGITYCSTRCAYCSFPSALLPVDEEQIVCLLEAIGQDIQAVVKLLSTCGLTVRTLYIGGGTPTCLPDKLFAQLMIRLASAFDIAALQEFTVEAGRPDSISPEKLQFMRQAGATRISVNPQTMKQSTLDRIGRRHEAQQTVDAFRMVRAAGFERVNMDLIAGLPGETAADVKSSLTQVLVQKPENITVHTLALKRGTELTGRQAASDLPEPTAVRLMVEQSALQIKEAGMIPYYLYRQKNSPGNLENVGYAKPGSECVYNIDMIEERRTIIGMGPSAASKAVVPNGWRLDSCHFPKDIPTYIRRIGELAHKREQLIKSLFMVEKSGCCRRRFLCRSVPYHRLWP